MGKTGPGPLYLNWYTQLGRPMWTVSSIVVALCFDKNSFTYYLMKVKINLEHNFNQPTYPCITEILCGNVRSCSKDRHRLYVIINMGQKIRGIKISPMRAVDEKGENFLQAKNFQLYGMQQIRTTVLVNDITINFRHFPQDEF